MSPTDLLAAAATRADDARHRIPSDDGPDSFTTLARGSDCRLRIPAQIIASGQTITIDDYRRWESRSDLRPEEPAP